MTAVLESASTPPAAGVEERLDLLTTQLAEVVAEVRAQRAAREQRAALVHDLMPVARGALDIAGSELTDLTAEVGIEDAVRFARTTARALPRLEVAIRQLESMADLGHEVTSIAGAGVARVSDSLATAEAKGYFAFARQGAGIVDKVVTNFDEDDVEALGDNIVLILDTVRQMTQPEIMGMLRRTAVQAQHAEETAEPPSMLALARQMRDPATRRGLARALSMLRSLGEEPGTPT